jgi:hypothetical protein
VHVEKLTTVKSAANGPPGAAFTPRHVHAFGGIGEEKCPRRRRPNELRCLCWNAQ